MKCVVLIMVLALAAALASARPATSARWRTFADRRQGRQNTANALSPETLQASAVCAFDLNEVQVVLPSAAGEGEGEGGGRTLTVQEVVCRPARPNPAVQDTACRQAQLRLGRSPHYIYINSGCVLVRNTLAKASASQPVVQ